MTAVSDSRRTLLHALVVASALYLTLGLAVLVPWSGELTLAGVARVAALPVVWLGVYGVVRERSAVVEIAALALALLGFWQPVAWVVVLPAGAALALAAAALARWTDEGADVEDSDDDGESEEGPVGAGEEGPVGAGEEGPEGTDGDGGTEAPAGDPADASEEAGERGV